jgi:hypothetical protein
VWRYSLTKAIKFARPRKVNFNVFSNLELMHLAAPLKDHHMLLSVMVLQVLMVHLALRFLRAPVVLLLVPQRRKKF